MNRLPSFFVVGAAKSGTTALWSYFQQHPSIYVTTDIRLKELGYFSNQYGVTDKNEYMSYFRSAKADQIIGEVCHVYLTSEESATWIKQEVPKAKIVILLRNPIARAYSLYNWMTMHGYEKVAPFSKAIDIESSRNNDKNCLHNFFQNYKYFSSGLYYHQVKRYIDSFGEKHVLIMAYEEFRKNQLEKLNEIYEFLGVDPVEDFRKEQINKSKRVLSLNLQFYLRKMFIKYRHKPNGKRIFKKLMDINTIPMKPKKIGSRLSKRLEQDYYEDVKSLSDLCKKDFGKIWFKGVN